MDGQTGLMLAFQLLALCSIAGALLFYLLCKSRETSEQSGPRQGGAVLITSADTALGLQLTTHLASRGYRVFAGMRDPTDSLPAKLLRNWLKARDLEQEQSPAGVASPPSGTIIPLRLDVSREDLLREAADCVTSHLPAGERGVQAVINTSGTVFRGRLENQDVAQWEAMFKTNILGYVRSARVFTQLLRPTRGRFLSIGSNFAQNPAAGCPSDGEGLVVFQASRSAVEGASMALKQELQQLGIDVVVLKPDGIQAEQLFAAPKRNASGATDDVMQYTASVLGPCGLRTIEKVLGEARPAEYYSLGEKQSAWSMRGSYCSRKKQPAPATMQAEMITV